MEKSATNIYSYGAVTGESNPIEVARKAKTASRNVRTDDKGRLSSTLFLAGNKAEICLARDSTARATERREGKTSPVVTVKHVRQPAGRVGLSLVPFGS